MGVFKEEAHTFEDLAKLQRQIYNDAADYGFPYYTGKTPQEVDHVFESIKTFQTLDKKYPDEKPFIRQRESWKGGVRVKIRIAWEIDEGMECGTEYDVSYCFIGNQDRKPNFLCKGCNAFISIDISRYRENHKLKYE